MLYIYTVHIIKYKPPLQPFFLSFIYPLLGLCVCIYNFVHPLFIDGHRYEKKEMQRSQSHFYGDTIRLS